MVDLPRFEFSNQEDWFWSLPFSADDGSPLPLLDASGQPRVFEVDLARSNLGLKPVRTLTMQSGITLTAGNTTINCRLPRSIARDFEPGEYTADILEVVGAERHLFLPVRIAFGEPISILGYLRRQLGVIYSAARLPIVTPVAIAGRQGAPGATILTGLVPPTAGVGLNGDYFIEDRTASSQGRRMYGPKAGGAWPGAPWVIQVAGIADVPGLPGRLDEKADAVATGMALSGKASTATRIIAAGLATGGGDLTANRTITVPAATAAEAQTGTATDKAVTPAAGAEAIKARAAGGLTSRLDLGAVQRTIGESLRDRVSVRDFGSTGSGAAQRIGTRLGTEDLAAIQALYPFVTAPAQENEYVAFQAAIDALPAVGGEILIPAGDYATLNATWAALLVPRGKLIRWVAYGARNLPKKNIGIPGGSGNINALPGLLLDTRPFLMQEGSAGRPSNAWTIADLGSYSLPDRVSQQDSVHEVIAHLEDDAGVQDSELRGFSAHLSTNHRDGSHSIKAFRGGVIGNGGSAKIRSIRLASESRNNHNGILVGGMFSAWRSWVDPLAYQMNDAAGVSMPQSAAVIAQAGAGCRYAFLAQGFDAKNRCYSAYAMTGGAQATMPEFACLDLHVGGAGHVMVVAPDENSVGSNVNSVYLMEKSGRMHAKGGIRSSQTVIAVPVDGVASIPCPSNGGLVMVVAIGVGGGNLLGQYRTSATPGSVERVEGMFVGSTFAAPGTAVNYTGTTGASGKITVGVYGTNLQIENRSGAARAFQLLWIG